MQFYSDLSIGHCIQPNLSNSSFTLIKYIIATTKTVYLFENYYFSVLSILFPNKTLSNS